MQNNVVERASIARVSSNVGSLTCQDVLAKNHYWIGNYWDTFGKSVSESAYSEFCKTWDQLPSDKFMADGGKYRSRRFSEFIYDIETKELTALPHRPFFQPKYLNNLNGGIDREFDPITPFIAYHPLILTMVENYCAIFSKIIPAKKWKFYLHQVRISAANNMVGKPSPEGIHKDGVTFSTLFCVNRRNVDGAENVIYDNEKKELARATLSNGESIIFNDSGVYHYVTPMAVIAGEEEAARDMLFMEFIAQ